MNEQITFYVIGHKVLRLPFHFNTLLSTSLKQIIKYTVKVILNMGYCYLSKFS